MFILIEFMEIRSRRGGNKMGRIKISILISYLALSQLSPKIASIDFRRNSAREESFDFFSIRTIVFFRLSLRKKIEITTDN